MTSPDQSRVRAAVGTFPYRMRTVAQVDAGVTLVDPAAMARRIKRRQIAGLRPTRAMLNQGRI